MILLSHDRGTQIVRKRSDATFTGQIRSDKSNPWRACAQRRGAIGQRYTVDKGIWSGFSHQVREARTFASDQLNWTTLS